MEPGGWTREPGNRALADQPAGRRRRRPAGRRAGERRPPAGVGARGRQRRGRRRGRGRSAGQRRRRRRPHPRPRRRRSGPGGWPWRRRRATSAPWAPGAPSRHGRDGCAIAESPMRRSPRSTARPGWTSAPAPQVRSRCPSRPRSSACVAALVALRCAIAAGRSISTGCTRRPRVVRNREFGAKTAQVNALLAELAAAVSTDTSATMAVEMLPEIRAVRA